MSLIQRRATSWSSSEQQAHPLLRLVPSVPHTRPKLVERQKPTQRLLRRQRRQLAGSASDQLSLTERLKEHVVQLEALAVYGILFVGVLAIANAVPQIQPYLLLIACLFLAGVRSVFRVMNPTSSVRNRLAWGATLGGLGAALGTAAGAVLDIASLGLTAGGATAIGLAAGGAIGTAAGERIEGWRNAEDLLERGKAFEYLYKRRHSNPRLANPALINKLLDSMPKYDINQDGKHRYTIDDLRAEAARR